MIRRFPILKLYLFWLRFGLAKIIFGLAEIPQIYLSEIPQIYLAEILLVLTIRRCRCWGWLVDFFFIKQTIEKPESRFSRQGLNFFSSSQHLMFTSLVFSSIFVPPRRPLVPGWSEDKKSPKLSSPLTFLATWPLFNLAIELLWCEGGDDSWLILQESTFRPPLSDI